MHSPKHSARLPSVVSDVYWIYAERRDGDYPDSTERSGKWLVFVPASAIDAAWETIRTATVEGRLGGASKVATARQSSLAKDPHIRVICVYTYDWKDEVDVMRVRQQLRSLGFAERLGYKADADTAAGNYAGRGKRVCKYYA